MPEEARTWQVVLEKIESDLLDGVLAPGDRLPPERELASTLGVGRSSVREALRVLEVMGLLRTGTGSGPTAGAIIIATPQGGMSALLRLHVAAHGFPLDDVVATRLILEAAVVEILSADRTKSTQAALDIVDAMDADDLSAGEFLALDARLHLALAEASGNVVITAMMAGLRTSIETYVQAGAARIPDWPSTAARLRAEHRAILEAVDSADAASARTLIREHISGYYAEAGLART
ncbi:FCD domain-containing protein [Microbacterium lacus]|uniref:FCD domain-containing protein n=1 Tax=Microbacterium lacus TaxID=415217 RepID=A0ABP4T161_9MICO